MAAPQSSSALPPSQPQPSRSPSRRSSQQSETDDGRVGQQAGRSSSNLAAHAAAQSLREASRPSSSGQASQISRTQSLTGPFNGGRRPSLPSNATSSTNGETPLLSLPTLRPPMPMKPRRPMSHSGPSLSITSSLSSRNELDEVCATDSSSSLPRSRTATAAGSALAAEMTARSGLQTPTGRVSVMSRPHLSQIHNESTASLPKPSSPKSVRELGSDYTRYYNPFATRNNSQQSLPMATPLPRYNSATHLIPTGISSTDLHDRLADPFNIETKRMSNPFATAPSTPVPGQDVAGNEKETSAISAAALDVSAVAPRTATSTATSVGRSNTPAFIRDADPEKAAFCPYLDDRLGAPDYAVPLFSDQKEDDDDMHMPQWDDDIRLRPKFKDHFTRENLSSTIGMIFMIVGLLCVFVVLPIISYTGTSIIDYTYETPMSQMPNPDAPEAWATVNNKKYPLFKNMRSGLIDPDTPKSAKSKKGINGDDYVLVFSDEFNQPNRTFYEGDDPYWFGGDFWYGATQDLEWYDPDAINTGDGTLQLQLDHFQNHGLDYRSGMLNSWNQLCFKGGIFEVSMSLPGPAGRHLYWPGVWTMGNLGRPGHLSTTDGLWPYTYQECDTGITPNQSMTDGTSHLPGQRLPSCTCNGEDHPSPGYGRGAPEIDIAEVSADWGGMNLGVATQSFQVAPFDIWYYPNYDFMQTPNYSLSFVNTYTGGPFQQAVSTTSMLNNNWYDGIEYQKYAFEYQPGGDKNSFIAWTIGDEEMMRFDARAIGPNGNIGQRLISEEPMSMILNLGFSKNWVLIDYDHLKLPTVMRVDYVRWYQKEGQEMVTCDPPGYETTQYIADHPEAYTNPNYTHWSETGYDWPKNTLMHGCKA